MPTISGQTDSSTLALAQRAAVAGLVIPGWHSPWDIQVAAYVQQALAEARDPFIVPGSIREKIEHYRSTTGLSPKDPWAYTEVQLLEDRQGEKIASGTLVIPDLKGTAPAWFHGLMRLPFQAPHEWSETHRGYLIESFGRWIETEEDWNSCPREAHWSLQLDPPATDNRANCIDIAAYCSRAISPQHAVFAQVDWRPGWPSITYSYGGVKPGAKAERNSTRAADNGFHLLADFREQIGRPGTSDEEALAEAVQHGREWLEEHPELSPGDFKRANLADRLCIQVKSLDTWLLRKHLTMKMIRDRLR